MPAGLGTWLRQQREARGLTRPELARQLIQAGQARGDRSMPGRDSMCHNIYRWERGEGGLSERYRLAYCHALGLRPGQFGPGDHPGQPGPAVTIPGGMLIPASPVIPATATGTAPQPWPPTGDPADPRPLPAPAIVAYRGVQEPHMGNAMVMQEVLMAAHEGSDRAEEYEQHGIGEVTFEQLRADVVRLARIIDTESPLPVFLDMRRVRGRIYRLLDRRLWPREQTDLHLLLGCLNGLMGIEANRLGLPDAAEELIRAGFASATAIDHRPLQAQLRQQLSSVMFLRGRIRESDELALNGLEYLSDGPEAGHLHLNHARAAAVLGDAESARQAVGAAHDAREREHSDELLDIGGEFAVSLATHHAMAGAAFASIQGAGGEAARELEHSISLYDGGPGPGEDHWFGGKPLASIDLAVIRLRSGAVDAVAEALGPTLSLPPAQRISDFGARLAVVRAELAAPVFRGSAQARTLDEQIEEFSREAAAASLPALPAGPG